MNQPFSHTTERISSPSLLDRYFDYTSRLSSGDGILLKITLLIFFISTVWFLITLSTQYTVPISTSGGSFTEGIFGTPRFVNPVLAVTRADKDMTTLIYGGLMRLGEDGTLTPDIAESVTLSSDGLTYNILLRDDVVFHDGTPLTAADVVFTIGRIQDPALTSPLRSRFEGVHVEEVGTHELNIILPEPYIPFIENLTVGILPRHIWKDATIEEFPFSQHNSEPIGSGPYRVSNILRNASGIPEEYILIPHSRYHAGIPKIETLRLTFFSSEDKIIDAFEAGDIDAMAGIDSRTLPTLDIDSSVYTIARAPLPRTFALFFNQNKSAALRDSAARKALSNSVNREELITDVLGGYGTPLYGPIPPGFGYTRELSTTSSSTLLGIPGAREILKDGGWKLDADENRWYKEIDGTRTPLALTISTVNNPVFEATAEYLRETWEKLGVSVSIRQFEFSDFTQAIIRPRDYESLLFGAVVGRAVDLYSFWHSSQKSDPGLNVALYTSITADSVLTQARTSASSTIRANAYKTFDTEVEKETPAVFLYTPDLVYVYPRSVTGIDLTGVAETYERFHTVHNWYMTTESIWPLFTE